MEKEKDENYYYEITDFTPNNINMLKEIKSIIAVLHRDNWVTQYQKNILQKQ